jgi:gas vesicle protein
MFKGGLIAAGLALAAWYFLEPKKGPDRRKKVADTARDVYDNASTELNRLGKDISEIASDVVDRVSTEAGRVSEQFSKMTGSTNGSSQGTQQKTA